MKAKLGDAETIRRQLTAKVGPEIVALILVAILILTGLFLVLPASPSGGGDRLTSPTVAPSATEPR